MTCPSITGAEPRLPSDPKTLPPRLADISNNCECAFLDGSRAGYMFKDIDTYDEAAVRSVYTLTRAAADRCYNASYWQLLGKDGQTRFHFLEHVGTQALVHDLEVLRVALGLERYSIYGSSYGTMVGAVYASVFPSRVDRLVLDGNMFPLPDVRQLGVAWGETVSQVIQFMLENCRVKPECALRAPFEAYHRVLELCRRRELRSPTTADGSTLPLSNGLFVGYLHSMAAERGCGYKRGLVTLALLADDRDIVREAGVVAVLDRMCRVAGTPTWRRYSACIDDVMVGKDTDPIMGTAVLALDFAGRLSVDGGVQLWRTAKSLYGTDVMGHMIGYTASMGTWRAPPRPVAPFGSASVRPLVLGNLYDQATGYLLSQRMAAAFPQSSMVTYQGAGHCLDLPPHDWTPARPPNLDPLGTTDCNHLVKEYLRTGVLPENGHTCPIGKDAIPVPTNTDVAREVSRATAS